MISALARAVSYTPPNLMMTDKQVLNMKSKVGEAKFNDLVNRVEFAINTNKSISRLIISPAPAAPSARAGGKG